MMRYLMPQKHGGFSLVEVLVAMAVGILVLAVISGVFLSQEKALQVEKEKTRVLQNARQSLEKIVRTVRMAGYDPARAGFDGVEYNPSQLRIRMDLNGDRLTIDTNENITYAFEPSQGIIQCTTGGKTTTLASNIENFTFTYLDAAGNPTIYSKAIRQIGLSVTAKKEKPGDNNKVRSRILATRITPENLGL